MCEAVNVFKLHQTLAIKNSCWMAILYRSSSTDHFA